MKVVNMMPFRRLVAKHTNNKCPYNNALHDWIEVVLGHEGGRYFQDRIEGEDGLCLLTSERNMKQIMNTLREVNLKKKLGPGPRLSDPEIL